MTTASPRIIRNYDDLADAIVERMRLAIVHRIPREVFAELSPFGRYSTQLYMKRGRGVVHIEQTAEYLEIILDINDERRLVMRLGPDDA